MHNFVTCHIMGSAAGLIIVKDVATTETDIFENVADTGNSSTMVAQVSLMKRRRSYSLLPHIEVPSMSLINGSKLPVICEEVVYKDCS